MTHRKSRLNLLFLKIFLSVHFIRLSLHRLKPWKGGGNVVTRIIVGYTSFGFWVDCGLALHTRMCDTTTPVHSIWCFWFEPMSHEMQGQLGCNSRDFNICGQTSILTICLHDGVSIFAMTSRCFRCGDEIYVVSHSYDICLVTSKKRSANKV